jgi:hypothetical protein
MPTLLSSLPLSPRPLHSPPPLSRLWRQLPPHVREPLLGLLSQILTRQLPAALPAEEEDEHEQTRSH